MTLTPIILAVRHLVPQPRVLSADEIERASFIRSILWDGENGAGEPTWKDDAEFEDYLNSLTLEQD